MPQLHFLLGARCFPKTANRTRPKTDSNRPSRWFRQTPPGLDPLGRAWLRSAPIQIRKTAVGEPRNRRHEPSSGSQTQGGTMTTSADARPSGFLRQRRFCYWLASCSASRPRQRSGSLVAALLRRLLLPFLPIKRNPMSPPSLKIARTCPKGAALRQAWGTLGQAFRANLMEEESLLCFAEAERLDPSNPRWPYYRGGTLMERGDPDFALPYLWRRRSLRRGAGQSCAALGAGAEPAGPRSPGGGRGSVTPVLVRQPDDLRTHSLALAASAHRDWQTSKSHLLRCLSSPFTRQKASRAKLAVVSRAWATRWPPKYHQQAGRLPADSEWSDPSALEICKLGPSRRRVVIAWSNPCKKPGVCRRRWPSCNPW